MEPTVRYMKTPDGISLAYWTMGEGTMVLHLFPWASHLQLEWQIPSHRFMYEELISRHTVLRFDTRGCGLSQHGVAITLDALVSDISFVLDTIGAESCSILAAGASGPVAVSFAARHPNRVDRLILWEAPAAANDAGPQTAAFYELIERDYDMWVQAFGSVAAGFDQNQDARAFSAIVRGAMTPAEMLDFTRANRTFDSSALLGGIACPTLVVHHRDAQLISWDAMQRIASEVPNAQLTLLDGSTVYGSMIEGVATILEFLGDGKRAPRSTSVASGVRTVLFTDLVGHTEMMRRLGDARGRELLREHERLTREAMARHVGTVIKTDGDSFMISFGSVASAMECAVALQRAFAHYNATASEPLRVRMGLNAGEPIEEHGDLFGESVILAARIAAEAAEGEILIAEPVRHLLAGKSFVFADRGEFVPKGFEDAVRLFEVRWRE